MINPLVYERNESPCRLLIGAIWFSDFLRKQRFFGADAIGVCRDHAKRYENYSKPVRRRQCRAEPHYHCTEIARMTNFGIGTRLDNTLGICDAKSARIVFSQNDIRP